jgi:hypothetical protein
MALATEITLPAGVEPQFPPLCVVCNQTPDAKIKIAHNSQNPLLSFFVPILFLFGWSTVTVPICRGCKPRFRFQRWGRQLITIVLVFAAIWLIYPQFKGWSPFARKVVVGLLAILAIMPYILFEVFWPKFFDTTAGKSSIDYEFADSDYAVAFHRLNAEHVLKSDVQLYDPSED